MVVLNQEDLGLYSRWVRRLLAHHCNGASRVVLQHHKYDGKLENDLVIKCEWHGERVREVIIEVELKENDIYKVLEQALKRREKVHYSYVALDLPAYEIMKMISRPSIGKPLFTNRIGVISMADDCVLIKSYLQKQCSFQYYSLIRFLGGLDDGEA